MRGAIAGVVNSPLWANQRGENVRECLCCSKGLESRYVVQVMIELSWQLKHYSTTYQHLVLNIGVLDAGKLAEWGLKCDFWWRDDWIRTSLKMLLWLLWVCSGQSLLKVVTEKSSGHPATASWVSKARWSCRAVKTNRGGPVHGWATVYTVLTERMCASQFVA